MERKAVQSSSIASVGYDARSKTLEVEFGHGAVYQYAGVPERRYTALVKASSVGGYFVREIKPWYACTKVG